MSAFGPKRTSVVAPHMSAFGGKADMTGCGCLLSRSLLGVKGTWLIAAHMSAYDPKRTCASLNERKRNSYDGLCASAAKASQARYCGGPYAHSLGHSLRIRNNCL